MSGAYFYRLRRRRSGFLALLRRRKERFELFDVLLAVFADGKLRLPPQSHVALFEEFEDGEKCHLVAGVGRRLEEFPRGNGVLSADSADESQRRQELILREKNWRRRRRRTTVMRRTREIGWKRGCGERER